MFFGMCNSPATFQVMMDLIFADLIEKGYVIVYMDDILCQNKGSTRGIHQIGSTTTLRT